MVLSQYTTFCHLGIGWVELDADKVAAMSLGYDTRGPGSRKRIENEAVRRGARKDTWLDQCWGERCEVGFLEGLRGHDPNRTLVALLAYCLERRIVA